MNNRLALLAQRVVNTPLAMCPQHAGLAMAAVASRFGISQVLLEGSAVQPMAFFYSDDADDRKPRHEYLGYDTIDGVACIPVEGTLVQKTGSIRPYCGMTGYDGLRAAFANAIDDKDVKAIVLHIDSPGGEVAGCFDLVDTIARARGIKPIWAICDEVAYSAAYAIASSADVISLPRTGGAGSIGVIALCADMSRAYDKAGVTVNIISYGKRKADGNQYEPLSDEARSRFQASVDDAGDLFVATVARNRDLTIDAVRGTEAACLRPKEALELDLVDLIASPEEAFAELQRQLEAA